MRGAFAHDSTLADRVWGGERWFFVGAVWGRVRKAPRLGGVGGVPSLNKTGVNGPGYVAHVRDHRVSMRILPLDVRPSVHGFLAASLQVPSAPDSRPATVPDSVGKMRTHRCQFVKVGASARIG